MSSWGSVRRMPKGPESWSPEDAQASRDLDLMTLPTTNRELDGVGVRTPAGGYYRQANKEELELIDRTHEQMVRAADERMEERDAR